MGHMREQVPSASDSGLCFHSNGHGDATRVF